MNVAEIDMIFESERKLYFGQDFVSRQNTQGDWTQIFPKIPIGLPYEDGPRTIMDVKY